MEAIELEQCKEDESIGFPSILRPYLSISTAAIPQYEDIHDYNGGHSSEFKPMGYEWKMGDLDYGPDLLDKIHALSKRNAEEKGGI